MTTEQNAILIFPYSRIVGQSQLKTALELTYISPRLGGVLMSGQRGTGKSTAVRAFSQMMYHERLPVTLPINATEDRVVGGWDINALMKGRDVRKAGLLEEADEKGMLYVDEINLLDDHIVNVILDVTSTRVLSVQREGQNKELNLSFTLVGTMNPEEGRLRPQLLDRFGLMVSITGETNDTKRLEILENVLEFDKAIQDGDKSDFIKDAKEDNEQIYQKLIKAKEACSSIDVSGSISQHCIALTKAFQAAGNRGDYMLALAAQASAAREGKKRISKKHVADVAPLVLQHRRANADHAPDTLWQERDKQQVKEVLGLSS